MELNKEKIGNFIRVNNLSIRGLEKQAGLARNAILNILHDKSKNPSIEIVLKIAKVLNCSVEELFSFEAPALAEPHNKESLPEERVFYDRSLLNSIIDFIIKKDNLILKENFSIDNTLAIVKSIYKYSYLNNRKILDVNFAEWVLKDLSS